MNRRRVTVPLSGLLELAAARAGLPAHPTVDPQSTRLVAAVDAFLTAVEGDLSAADWAALGRARNRASIRRRPPSLCRRERETLEALLSGASEKEIASQLGISVHTVHQYVKAIYRRLEVTSRAQLMARALGAT